MANLNDIKINLGELRKALAELQSLGYEEVGLEYLLQYIYGLRNPPEEKSTKGSKNEYPSR